MFCDCSCAGVALLCSGNIIGHRCDSGTDIGCNQVGEVQLSPELERHQGLESSCALQIHLG